MHSPSVELNNGVAIIHISGPAVIDGAASIQQTFLEALDSQAPIQLDLSAVTECDASFVQLVVSLCQTLNRGGRSLELSPGAVPDSVRTTLEALGFHCRVHCLNTASNDCLLTTLCRECTPLEAATP
jgi:anti-anti-sigma regulatory factor